MRNAVEVGSVMIGPTNSGVVASRALSFDDFKPDAPYPHKAANSNAASDMAMIDGVTVTPLAVHSDARGSLCELLTTRDGHIEPIVHVYQVVAEAGSIRAWVYHRRQYDRLAFTHGQFRIALYDIRPDSPTLNMLNVVTLGSERPSMIRIPPLVIHGVQNIGSEAAMFVNFPTMAFDPRTPDKCRLPVDDPRVPFSFDA